MPVKLASSTFISVQILMMHPVKETDFSHIDEFDPRSKERKLEPRVRESKAPETEQIVWKPERLGNGKWACNHKCKDKTA